MNDLEAIVRASITDTAAKVNQKDLGPLHLPADGDLVGSGQIGPAKVAGKRRPARLLAALGAAAAVLAVIIGSFAVASSLRHDRSVADSSHPGPLAGIPRYFAELGGSAHGGAVIVDALTAKVIATVRPPKPYYNFVGVTAAANDRTFVLAAQTGSASPFKLYVLRLTLTGGKASTTLRKLALKLPAGWTPAGLALSPDGTELAVADAPSAPRPVEVRVYVYDLATGVVRTWSATGQIGNAWDTLPISDKTLSWAPDDRTLAYLFYPWAKRRFGNPAVYLLDSGSPGGGLLNHSRRLIPFRADGYDNTGGWDLTLDGTRVEIGETKNVHSASGQITYYCRIKEYSAVTGRLIAVRDLPEHDAGLSEVLWASAAARTMIVDLFRPPDSHIPVQVLRGNRLIPIKGLTNVSGSAW
jgi:hypothetical protein